MVQVKVVSQISKKSFLHKCRLMACHQGGFSLCEDPMRYVFICVVSLYLTVWLIVKTCLLSVVFVALYVAFRSPAGGIKPEFYMYINAHKSALCIERSWAGFCGRHSLINRHR
jgi:hypothetical protein